MRFSDLEHFDCSDLRIEVKSQVYSINIKQAVEKYSDGNTVSNFRFFTARQQVVGCSKGEAWGDEDTAEKRQNPSQKLAYHQRKGLSGTVAHLQTFHAVVDAGCRDTPP